MNLHVRPSGLIQTNAYLLTNPERGEAVLIDAPGEVWAKVQPILEAEKCELKELWITHGHWDHTQGAAEVVRMAKDAANEGVKRAKTLVRDAKPLIEDGMRKAAPALKNAGERAKRGYARQIRNVQSNLAPVRRKMKAKMKQIDLLKPYATDRHINNLFQATYTLILALCVHRALGVLYRFAFGRRSRSVPRHVRSKSVELRPLSPDR